MGYGNRGRRDPLARNDRADPFRAASHALPRTAGASLEAMPFGGAAKIQTVGADTYPDFIVSDLDVPRRKVRFGSWL